LDEINQQIVAMLSCDSRMSATEIGKRVHRSRVAVQNRISALIASGEITGFGITLKSKALPVLFEVAFSPIGACDVIVPRFRKKHHIIKAWSVTGSADLFIWTEAGEANEVHAMRNFLLKQPEVARVLTHTIVNTYG